MEEYFGPDPASIPPEEEYGPAQLRVKAMIEQDFGLRFYKDGVFFDSQWEALRDALQRFLRMENLNFALSSRHRAEVEAVLEDCVPEEYPPRTRYTTPHVAWMDFLEAAYEHFHDAAGLRRIYAFRLLTEPWDQSEDILEKLRVFCESDLPENASEDPDVWGFEDEDSVPLYITEESSWPRLARQLCGLDAWYFSSSFGCSRNRAIEQILCEQELSDEAWRYFKARVEGDRYAKDALLEALGDTLRISHEEELLAILTSGLRDADSPLLSRDTGENRRMILAQLTTVAKICGQAQLEVECARLKRMYPSRTELHAQLDELCGELDYLIESYREEESAS